MFGMYRDCFNFIGNCSFPIKLKTLREDRHGAEENFVAEATRRRRRILQAGFFYRISNLTSKKFKKLVIEIMTHFAYDNINILMRQNKKKLKVKLKQAIWLIDMSFLSDHMRGDSYYEYSEQHNYKTCRDSPYGCVMLCIFYILAD